MSNFSVPKNDPDEFRKMLKKR